ncbi:MAG: phosphatase PAP2 family protein [Crocinitomicaceae bacterium]|nr:phosphatase PAP2 family protein [Crocinitomicaceae bacterium]
MERKKILLPIILYISLLAALGFLVLATEKGSAELAINGGFNKTLGQFFRYATHLGDGIMYAILIALFLLIKYYNALLLFFMSILQTILAQGFKKIVFPDSPRPAAWFENQEGVVLQFAEGVKIHTAHSFPSGHTATAFAIAVMLTYFFKKPVYAFLFFLLAATAGFSRVYLMQHFFEDVLAGATVGIFSAVVVIFLVRKFLPEWESRKGLQGGLIRKG